MSGEGWAAFGENSGGATPLGGGLLGGGPFGGGLGDLRLCGEVKVDVGVVLNVLFPLVKMYALARDFGRGSNPNLESTTRLFDPRARRHLISFRFNQKRCVDSYSKRRGTDDVATASYPYSKTIFSLSELGID